MQARFAGTIDGHSRRRHKAQPRGDVHNGGVFVLCQQGDEQPGKNDCRLQINPNFILTPRKSSIPFVKSISRCRPALLTRMFRPGSWAAVHSNNRLRSSSLDTSQTRV